jgi:hypothetical protein
MCNISLVCRFGLGNKETKRKAGQGVQGVVICSLWRKAFGEAFDLRSAHVNEVNTHLLRNLGRPGRYCRLFSRIAQGGVIGLAENTADIDAS